jgi:hypothetical protein
LTLDNDQAAIETDFIESWDLMQSVYEQHRDYGSTSFNPQARLSLISELRKRGYDRHFLAGSQLFNFILSRSRLEGLRQEQARVYFNIDQQGRMTAEYQHRDTKILLEFDRVEVTNELEQLLARLREHPID